LVIGVLASALKAMPTVNQETWPIIVRRDGALYEGDRPFRFLGLAASNLHQNEGQLLPDFSNRFPDDFEIRDVLGALHQMGARATRCFALSITAPADGGVPVYLSGRRTYNEEAFRALDRVLSLCREYDVRAYEEKRFTAPEALHVDESTQAGRPFFYRIKAANASGETDYSNVVECTRPERQTGR
jgi:hypothetical protein